MGIYADFSGGSIGDAAGNNAEINYTLKETDDSDVHLWWETNGLHFLALMLKVNESTFQTRAMLSISATEHPDPGEDVVLSVPLHELKGIVPGALYAALLEGSLELTDEVRENVEQRGDDQ